LELDFRRGHDQLWKVSNERSNSSVLLIKKISPTFENEIFLKCGHAVKNVPGPIEFWNCNFFSEIPIIDLLIFKTKCHDDHQIMKKAIFSYLKLTRIFCSTATWCPSQTHVVRTACTHPKLHRKIIFPDKRKFTFWKLSCYLTTCMKEEHKRLSELFTSNDVIIWSLINLINIKISSRPTCMQMD